MAIWEPQRGPQLKAVMCPADVTFFGGSRGGGKSDCLIGRQLAGAQQYGGKWNGLIIRRKYKDFAEIRRRVDELISLGMPAEIVGGPQQTNHLRFENGARVAMPAIGRIEQVNDFVGHQYTEISIDEATTFPFFIQMVDKLRGSLRSPHGVPCRMFVTGNPGGPGHNAVKEFFRLGTGGVNPETVIRIKLADGLEETRVFIPSFLDDNKILCANDPKYVARLKAIQDPALRRAWIDGDWDVYIGQAFGFSREVHVIDPVPVPDNAPLYFSFDWGFGKPFSIGWWWVDNDGCVYRFHEWYGWNGQPDEGLRLSDTDIAIGIKDHEDRLGIGGRQITRLAGPDCFQKRPDFRGGGQGPSTAEVFYGHGIELRPGDPARSVKIRQFRERLRYGRDESTGVITSHPRLKVYSTCRQFIRTIPSLSMDELRPEDVDTDQEDHVYDESCHIVMARPISQPPPEPADPWVDLDSTSRRAAEIQQQYFDELKREQEYVDIGW